MRSQAGGLPTPAFLYFMKNKQLSLSFKSNEKKTKLNDKHTKKLIELSKIIKYDKEGGYYYKK